MKYDRPLNYDSEKPQTFYANLATFFRAKPRSATSWHCAIAFNNFPKLIS